MEKKIFKLRCSEGNLGRYNATHIYTVTLVCDSEIAAIRSVLKRDTISIEVLSVEPCLFID